MNPVDYIIIAVVLAILGCAALYIYKSKKGGKKCVGCPYAANCSSKSGCCPGSKTSQ